MNYLRKKLQAIMACADFKGYLREVTGAPPLRYTVIVTYDGAGLVGTVGGYEI